MTFETKVISSALFIEAICVGETRATSSQTLPRWRRYPAAVLKEPRRMLRHQALNALSSSRRREYLIRLFSSARGLGSIFRRARSRFCDLRVHLTAGIEPG